MTDNYRLVCRFGSQRRVEEFETCNLGRLPPNFLVTSGTQSPERYLELSQLLVRLAEMFGGRVRNSFRLFGPYKGQSNLMFADSAVTLEPLPYQMDYRQALGQHLQALEDSDPKVCSSAIGKVASNSLLFTVLIVLIAIVFN